MMWFSPFLTMFLVAFVTAVATTPLARRIAIRADAVDYPNARRINKTPIPRMGGIAIFLAICAAAAFMRYCGPELGWPVILVRHLSADLDYRIIAVGFLIMFLTGVIDDIVQLKPLAKFCGQVLAAAVAASGGLVIGNITNPFGGGVVVLGWLSYPITIIYLVAFANIINLIDGLDGLATGISCIASTTLFVLAFQAGHLDAAALAVATAGATAGFLPYNFHPASIFLGDSGSLLLGFSLGTISILNVTRLAGLTTIIIPLVVAGVPIIDTFSAIIRRRRAHVSIGHADRGHIHHRLIDEGFDQRQAVLLIYAWTLLLCVGSVIMTQVTLWPRVTIFVVLVIASVFFARHLHLFEPVLRHHLDPVTGDDELVTPDDPAFKVEEEKAEEAHEERMEHLREMLPGEHGDHDHSEHNHDHEPHDHSDDE
jgi:UDP-GlcNAc:undecaprenyl-phosphate GlcNAc-1-phosphate transferase